MVKKDTNSLIEQTLENIKNDRQETEYFLQNLKEYMSVSSERVHEAGSTAAKFLETLQRSNEQLVKLAALVHKKETHSYSNSLSESDKEELFNIIKGD